MGPTYGGTSRNPFCCVIATQQANSRDNHELPRPSGANGSLVGGTVTTAIHQGGADLVHSLLNTDRYEPTYLGG
jgi:hypothetical protein